MKEPFSLGPETPVIELVTGVRIAVIPPPSRTNCGGVRGALARELARRAAERESAYGAHSREIADLSRRIKALRAEFLERYGWLPGGATR